MQIELGEINCAIIEVCLSVPHSWRVRRKKAVICMLMNVSFMSSTCEPEHKAVDHNFHDEMLASHDVNVWCKQNHFIIVITQLPYHVMYLITCKEATVEYFGDHIKRSHQKCVKSLIKFMVYWSGTCFHLIIFTQIAFQFQCSALPRIPNQNRNQSSLKFQKTFAEIKCQQ